MTAMRLNIITNSLLRLGKHGAPCSLIVNATMIAEGDMVDQLTDRRRFPSWTVVRHPMVIQMPPEDVLNTHWLTEYANIRNDCDPENDDSKDAARRRCNEYYLAHKEIMDAGSIVSWDDIPLDEFESSPIQHALNILIDEGPVVFCGRMSESAAIELEQLAIEDHTRRDNAIQ